MQGIREMAMSKPKKEPPKKRTESTYDPYDEIYNEKGDFNHGYSPHDPYDYEEEFEVKVDESTIITMPVHRNEFTNTFEFRDKDYDYQALEQEAKILAYDKAKELLGKSYEQKYIATYAAESIYNGSDYVILSITLKPITKK